MSTIIQNISKPRAGESTWLWLIKILTGGLLVILLLVHLIVNHFVVEGGLMTYANVVAYFQNPWIVFMEICFLATVVSHSLIALRSILLDMNPAPNVLNIINWVLGVVGVGAVVYGVWLALTIASK